MAEIAPGFNTTRRAVTALRNAFAASSVWSSCSSVKQIVQRLRVVRLRSQRPVIGNKSRLIPAEAAQHHAVVGSKARRLAHRDGLPINRAVCSESPRTSMIRPGRFSASAARKLVKRSAYVVGIFPDAAAITRLIGAVLLEANDEWETLNRHLQNKIFSR